MAAPSRSHLGKRKFRQENAGARSPFLLDDSRNPSSVKRVRGSDPEPPPPAAWQLRREWGGPAPSRGTPGAGPTPDAPGRGSRDRKQSNTGRGGGFAPRERGEGPAERVRSPSARMQHCDKAGPTAALGIRGERRRMPNVSTRISRFKSPRSFPLTRAHLQ